jgi:ATP/maltotriose-dependent transcriptional regulator MalT
MFVHRLKLRAPELSSKWIDRPALEARVEAASVVAIVAGPGYGKTVPAARSYHAHRPTRLWYSLDRADADLAVFAAHLHAAVRSLGEPDPARDAAWHDEAFVARRYCFRQVPFTVTVLPLTVVKPE